MRGYASPPMRCGGHPDAPGRHSAGTLPSGRLASEERVGLNFTVLAGFMLQPGALRGHQVNQAAAAATRTHADGGGRAA
jgi:hypothetical protein